MGSKCYSAGSSVSEPLVGAQCRFTHQFSSLNESHHSSFQEILIFFIVFLTQQFFKTFFLKLSCCYEPFVLFSLNALDPKLVWHIEKETKEGLGAWRRGGPNGQRN